MTPTQKKLLQLLHDNDRIARPSFRLWPTLKKGQRAKLNRLMQSFGTDSWNLFQMDDRGWFLTDAGEDLYRSIETTKGKN